MSVENSSPCRVSRDAHVQTWGLSQGWKGWRAPWCGVCMAGWKDALQTRAHALRMGVVGVMDKDSENHSLALGQDSDFVVRNAHLNKGRKAKLEEKSKSWNSRYIDEA